MADALALVSEIHGRLLRMACTTLDQHYERLAKIERVLAQHDRRDHDEDPAQPKNVVHLNKLEQDGGRRQQREQFTTKELTEIDITWSSIGRP